MTKEEMKARTKKYALRVIKAFQYVAKHGEVCPANWTEGKATMQADPKGAKTYFTSANK